MYPSVVSEPIVTNLIPKSIHLLPVVATAISQNTSVFAPNVDGFQYASTSPVVFDPQTFETTTKLSLLPLVHGPLVQLALGGGPSLARLKLSKIEVVGKAVLNLQIYTIHTFTNLDRAV